MGVTGPRGDGRRVFVVERGGRILVVRDGRARRTPFLDISGRVQIRSSNAAEDHGGLLSLAFAPDYSRSRTFYVFYTGGDGMLHLDAFRRLRRSADRADPGSRRAVLALPRLADFDFGGALAFGPDRLLYVGLGYSEVPSTSADLGSPFGKLLRIDPRPAGSAPYGIPADNPFAGRPGARPEVYAYGLRNPWRVSFDRLTGDLAIGDVGDSTAEEVDFVTRGRGRGADFGFPTFEASVRQAPGDRPGYVGPAIELSHADGNCAVIGGVVVRDRSLRGFYGRYLYADLCRGDVHSVRLGRGTAAGDRNERIRAQGITAFGEDARGHVYATTLGGSVIRLVAR